MPLPANNTAWPPTDLAPMRAKWTEWAAWYSNDTEALTTIYTKTEHTRPSEAGVRGAVRAVVKFFWGEKRTDLTKPAERKLHVPVAADLCQASSDLLFSEAPEIAVDVDGKEAKAHAATTADRLDKLAGPDFHAALASGAEIGAALGGCYLRATWDKGAVPDRPFLTVVDYDNAFPEFRWGRLVAVTFWHVVKTSNQEVWRHLERHETNDQGVGVIQHGLYRGRTDNLGMTIPLNEHPATADLATEVDAEATISTQSQGLDVFHWPNLQPQRTWRGHALGRHLGRSDLDGLESLLDALDEAYTSLMRDIRLGKAMLVVPQGMLTNNGPGGGTTFEQSEIYSPVNSAPGSVTDAKMQIEKVQFDIRVEKLEKSIALIWNTIIRSAGYSAQTFGEGGEAAQTATEVSAKERRSGLTQGRKGRTVRPVLEAAVTKLLAMDAALFNSGADTALPIRVELADGVKEDPEAIARTAQLLATALAASIETRVRMVNPGRNQLWIDAEVAKIMAENQMELADPATLGVDGRGLSDRFRLEA
ncbi:phage portal protein [Citricoccus sp.]|uniref:phage portal protein n=1 Tax=Citricoccus sp. TaxID=1978372 RepID=UPI0028BDF16C|nr:phage portal protein [Citricoccus sp.]